MVATVGTIEAKSKIVSFGINSGLGQTTYKSSEYGNVNSDIGFQVGASMSVDIIPIINISSEVQYINSHFEFDTTYEKVVNHYLSIPVVAGFSLLKIIQLEVGPRFTIIDKSVITPYDSPKFKRNGDLYETVGYLVGARIRLGKISVGGRFNGQFSKHDSDTFGEIGSHSYSISIGFNL